MYSKKEIDFILENIEDSHEKDYKRAVDFIHRIPVKYFLNELSAMERLDYEGEEEFQI